MRCALAIASMGLGGAQQIMAWLANMLEGAGHQVSLHTFDKPGSPSFFALSPGVRVEQLGLSDDSPGLASALLANARRVSGLRKSLVSQAPDVVLSFVDQMNVLAILAAPPGCPVIVSERIHPAHHRIGRIWDALRLACYGQAAAIVVQTEDIRDFFPNGLRKRCAVIPNPVAAPPDSRPSGGGAARPAIVGLGRLHRQKGFDLLLRAFAALRGGHPQWHLRIFGEGPEEAALKSLCAMLGLNADAIFPGIARDPYAALADADIFAMPSRFEGFPNALCQALASGVAVVATDCPGGSKTLVESESNGLLVPAEDVEGLKEGLARLMDDAELRARLAGNAPGILDAYEPAAVYRRWEALLRAAAERVPTIPASTSPRKEPS